MVLLFSFNCSFYFPRNGYCYFHFPTSIKVRVGFISKDLNYSMILNFGSQISGLVQQNLELEQQIWLQTLLDESKYYMI